MADKDKEAHVERESDAQSDMIQNSCLSDILKAITGLGSRMDNLQDQLNSLSQCDPAVPEQSEDSMVGDHDEEAGGVSYDCAGSAQTCDSFAGGEQFGRGSANSNDYETDSVSNMLVAVPQKRAGMSVDMLDSMVSDAELNVDETTGPPVLDKLAKIAVNRFTVPMQDKKLEEKLEKFKIPENCKAIMAPQLNDDLIQRHVGKLDNVAKRVDTKLHNVQSVLAKATAGILLITEKLHSLATSTSLAAAEDTKVDPHSILSQTNEMLAFNGDVIALLGNAHQELSTRRRFSLQSAFPKEIASMCQAKIPASSLLFGDDTDRLVKSAKEQFRAAQHRGGAHSSQRYHPYRRGGASGNRPFLGQGYGQGQSTSHYQRGNQRQRGVYRPHSARGAGRSRR